MKPEFTFSRVATLFLIGLSLLLSTSACNSIPDDTRRLETEDVTLEYLDKRRDRDIESITLQHPLRINADAVETQMRSLRFEHLSLVSKTKPVFEKEQVLRLKNLLTKALNHAKKNHFISFRISLEGRVTEGDLFASNGKLHWRLNKIDGEAFQRKAWARNVQLWRLSPGKGQSFFTKKLLMERDIQNWLVSRLDLPKPAPYKAGKKKRVIKKKRAVQKSSPTTTRAPATSKEKELERKLGILNGLRDKGLIDDTEFQQRRKTLLDQYF